MMATKPAGMPRPRLTLRQPGRESAPVREAKQMAREAGYDGDPHMIAFALALIEARDTWNNRPQAKLPNVAPARRPGERIHPVPARPVGAT